MARKSAITVLTSYISKNGAQQMMTLAKLLVADRRFNDTRAARNYITDELFITGLVVRGWDAEGNVWYSLPDQETPGVYTLEQLEALEAAQNEVTPEETPAQTEVALTRKDVRSVSTNQLAVGMKVYRLDYSDQSYRLSDLNRPAKYYGEIIALDAGRVTVKFADGHTFEHTFRGTSTAWFIVNDSIPGVFIGYTDPSGEFFGVTPDAQPYADAVIFSEYLGLDFRFYFSTHLEENLTADQIKIRLMTSEAMKLAIKDKNTLKALRYFRAIRSLFLSWSAGKLPADVQRLLYTACPSCDYQDWVKSDDEVLAPDEICYECVIEKEAQRRRDFWDDGRDEECESAPILRRVQFSHGPA